MPVTIDQMIDLALERLPQGWHLEIVVDLDEGGPVAILRNPDRDMVEPMLGSTATIHEEILARINAAREDECLAPIEVPGLRTW